MLNLRFFAFFHFDHDAFRPVFHALHGLDAPEFGIYNVKTVMVSVNSAGFPKGIGLYSELLH